MKVSVNVFENNGASLGKKTRWHGHVDASLREYRLVCAMIAQLM
jgi:hypothetical protein